MRALPALLKSEEVTEQIEELLLSGRCADASEAERVFLEEHVDEIARLVAALPEEALGEHEAVKLLLSHGSRGWEDAVG